MSNYNDYYRRNGYIGASTTNVDSTNDDWGNYFSNNVKEDMTYQEMEEIQKGNAVAGGTYMDAGPVVIKTPKHEYGMNQSASEWTVGNVDAAQMRMVAMQEQWNAMQASFSQSYEESEKMTREVEDDSDMILPRNMTVTEIANEIVESETAGKKVNLMDLVSTDVDDESETVVEEKEPVEEKKTVPVKPTTKKSKEIDASEMSNDELLASLGIEMSDTNTEPVIEFNNVSVDETTEDSESDDVVEIEETAEVESTEEAEDAKVISETKKKSTTTASTSKKATKTPAKTNKSSSTKTNKTTAKKK